MALNDQSYAHVTAHASQVIDRIGGDLREKLMQYPEQAEFWRGRYHAYAEGALAVWMAATSGLAHAQDAGTLAEKVRNIAEGE